MNESEQFKPKILDRVIETLSDFESKIAKYQKEAGERLKTEITWLDAFNNVSTTFSMLVPQSNPAFSIVQRIINKTRTLNADDLADDDKTELLAMIEELKQALGII